MNQKQIIAKVKKLIDMPYNQFNLDNYYIILEKMFKRDGDVGYCEYEKENPNIPTKLMSGGHSNAGLIYYSTHKPKLTIIGKGILFDSGGYNLKPTGHIEDMHHDKAGMIIALGLATICKEVQAICPVTTNFIHNSKICPADILQIGKHKVEVTNTDAEGRLILAEALSTLPKNHGIVVTIATLTGCCGYAIGKRATAVLSPNQKLADQYLNSAKKAKELAWQLPMFDYMQKSYKKDPIKNSVKDIMAGTSEGGMFLKQFIPNPMKWIHLDIAYSSFCHKTNKANGQPLKSLIEFVKTI